MNTLKGWITTLIIITAVLTSTTVAKAGTIIGGRSTGAVCTGGSGSGKADTLGGTIIGGLTGTIIGGFAGTIIGGLAIIVLADKDGAPTFDCGTIIGG